MDPQLWAKAHGASTHFPLALLLASLALDLAGFVQPLRPVVADRLHAAGTWTLLLGAAGSLAAVATGLLMTRGLVLGQGALSSHHLFVWPAFGLLVGLATWRLFTGPHSPRPQFAVYLIVTAAAAALMSAAGYWGGELLLAA